MPRRFHDEPPVAAADTPGGARAAARASASDADTLAAPPDWFADFLNDRATRKPSAHTMKAYRQDFTAVADLLTSGDPAGVALSDITKTPCGRRSPATRQRTSRRRSGGAGRRGMC